MKDKKEIIIPAVALFIICLVSTLLLALTNSVTEEKIEAVKAEQADAARKLVCTDAASFKISESGDGIDLALDASGEVTGYAVTTVDKSYGGDIEVMVGLDPDGNITGIQILTIDDTPGLGMNAKKDTFRDQFVGKAAGDLKVSKTASLDNEIQAITGATITSTAVTDCVTEAYRKVFLDSEGGAE